MKLSCCIAGAMVLSFAAGAPAIEYVVKHGNSRVAGTIKTVSAANVVLDRNGTLETIPVTDIEYLIYEGEPTDMNLVRSSLRAGSATASLEKLRTINRATLPRKEMQQDHDFYNAYAQARMALRNSDAKSIDEAGRAMYTFYENNKDSYHYFQAVETMGDLLTANGKSDEALRFYTELETAPSDLIKMRAGLAAGRALAAKAQGNTDAAAKTAGYETARQSYEKVLAITFDPKNTAAQTLNYAAKLGRAQCQAAAGKYDEAITELQDNVIAGLNAEETELQALAYVALGKCYENKPDSEKLALLAFLHVDMLYANAGEPHAEALWHMAKLFKAIKQDERGNECELKLNSLYPTSPWKGKK